MYHYPNLDKMANCKDRSGEREHTGKENRWNRPAEDIYINKARIQRKRSKIQLKVTKIEKHLGNLNFFIERDS